MNEQQRRNYLAAMNIEPWQLRSAGLTLGAQETPEAPSEAPLEAPPELPPELPPEPPMITQADDFEFELATESVPEWAIEPQQTTAAAPDPRNSAIAAMDWDELQTTVHNCTACPLHTGRTQSVFGVGNRQAEWLIVGEAPGAEEDRQGEPFVGRSGKLLDRMLQALELNRERVFIANIVKCRPPGNRDPQAEETHACRPFLQRQIALLKPRIILAVGRVAAQQLLDTTVTVGRLRARSHRLPDSNTPLVVTYHPAYLLRSPSEKRKVWDDLQRAHRTLLEETGQIRLNSDSTLEKQTAKDQQL